MHTNTAISAFGGRRGTRSRRRLASLGATGIALAVLWAVPAATEERGDTKRLHTFDPPGSVDTRPFGVTDGGDVVGLYISAAPESRTRGFLLTRGVFTSIDVPGSIRTNALGVTILRSRRGSPERLAVVGRYDTRDLSSPNPNASIAHGYVLADGELTTVDHPGTSTFTVITGVNPSGHLVGRYLHTESGLFRAFALVDGEFSDVVVPGALSVHAIGINARGDLAGYFEDPSNVFHGFLIRDGQFFIVDPPGSLATGGPGGIVGLNSREFVGTYSTDPSASPCGCSGTRGFVHDNGRFRTLDIPEANGTILTGVNTRGDIVGIFVDAVDKRRHGFLLLDASRHR